MFKGMANNLNVNVIFILVYIFSFMGQQNCAPINDTNILLRDVLEGYNKNVRPVQNQNDAINVNVTLFIISIQELDEIRGIFSVMGALSMEWYDANIVWDPKSYGNVDYVLTSYQEVWVPELVLYNPAEDLDSLGKKWHRVYFYHTGYAAWWPGGLIKSACNLNVYNYPFDSQECVLMFGAWGYITGQVKIHSGKNPVDLRFYTESSMWKFSKSKATTSSEGTVISFHIYLERKPGFVIVNIILPLTFLSLLNAFVFLLLPESGERISYCITVLLSIAVFMTIVSDTLPKSSEPVPFISYKLMIDLAISSLMTLITILNLRLYNRKNTDNVPNWLQAMYRLLSCKSLKSQIHPTADDTKNMINGRQETEIKCGIACWNRKGTKQRLTMANVKRQSVSIFDLEDIQSESIEKRFERRISNAEENNNAYVTVSWKDVSNMVDGIAFIFFTLLSVCSFAVFMVITFKA